MELLSDVAARSERLCLPILGGRNLESATPLRLDRPALGLAEASGSRTHRRRANPPPAGFEELTGNLIGSENVLLYVIAQPLTNRTV